MSETEKKRRSTCPINASLEVLGDRWTLLIVRDAIFGGARSYKDFLASAEGIATNILAARLARLQAFGILSAEADPSDRRKSNYRLTEKGVALVPVLMALSRWGTNYEDGAPPEGVLEAWEADPEAFVDGIRERLPV